MSRADPFYKQIAEAIIEACNENPGAFDLDNNNPDQHPTIHWLIAKYMLRGYTEHDKGRALYQLGWPSKVATSHDFAIDYATTTLNTPVYKVTFRDKRNIRVITTDAFYRDARERDIQRAINLSEKQIRASGDRIRKIAPERLSELTERTSQIEHQS
jgi:hypothetical protein